MRYIGRRVIHATLLLLGVSFFSFALLQSAPGDFFDELRLDPRVSPQTVEGLRSQSGLDRSLPLRYASWLKSIARGDLGVSLAYHGPVGPLIAVRARNTLLLAGTAMLMAWVVAIPLGIWASVNRGGWLSRIFGAATSTFLTVPELVLFLCLLLLAVRTGWFPAGGMLSAGSEDANLATRARDVAAHLFLPAFGLALVSLPILIRHVRSAMIDVLDSPFLRAARGHGMRHVRLLFRYALPTAANPLIALWGFSVGGMLSASLLAEIVLSWPGLGPLLIEAILSRDIYVVVSIVLFSAVFLVAGNLLSDLLLFAVDPRIRVE